MRRRAMAVVLMILGASLIIGGLIVGRQGVVVDRSTYSLEKCPPALDASPPRKEVVVPCAVVRAPANTAAILSISLGTGLVLSGFAVALLGGPKRTREGEPAPQPVTPPYGGYPPAH